MFLPPLMTYLLCKIIKRLKRAFLKDFFSDSGMYISFTRCSLICFYFQSLRDFRKTHFSGVWHQPSGCLWKWNANTPHLYLGLPQLENVFPITRLFSNLSHFIGIHKISGLKGTPKNIKSDFSNMFEKKHSETQITE